MGVAQNRLYIQDLEVLQVYKMRIILLPLIGFLMTACMHVHSPSIDVSYGERQTLYFTGRGAAAGIMMDSLLGGAGVAIGIAIDEGIAKDISAALLASNPKFSMVLLVEDGLRKQVKQGMNIDGVKSVMIDKYGFQSASDDKVVPLLELQFVCQSGTSEVAKFVPVETVPAIAFEQSKTDGKLVESKLRDATAKLLDVYDNPCKVNS